MRTLEHIKMWTGEAYSAACLLLKKSYALLLPRAAMEAGLAHFLPEVTLTIGLLLLLMYHSFQFRYRRRTISSAALAKVARSVAILLAIILAILVFSPEYFTMAPIESRHIYATSLFISFAKLIVILLFIILMIIIIVSTSRLETKLIEFPIILGLLAPFSMLALSANDALSMLVAIELMTLTNVAVMMLGQDPETAGKAVGEACLKYFLANSLGMIIIAFGFAGLYGVTGSIMFSDIAKFFSGQMTTMPVTPSFGMVYQATILIVVGFMIKLGAAPFHQWAIDAYTGANFCAFYYLSVISKFVLISVFFRVLFYVLPYFVSQFNFVIMLFAIASLTVGAIGGLVQKTIKRLFAYSSVFTVGFVLVGLAFAKFQAISSAYFYLLIYCFGLALILVSHALIVARKPSEPRIMLADLAGSIEVTRLGAFGMTLGLLSLMGLPPLVGFFAKFVYLNILMLSDNAVLALYLIIISMLPVYYYLRVIKLVFLENRTDSLIKEPTERLQNKHFFYSIFFLSLSVMIPFVFMWLSAEYMTDLILSLLSI